MTAFVGRAHVHRHGLQVLAAVGAEFVEEAGQRGGVLAFLGPHDGAAAVVGHQGQVVVLFAVGHLVHARLVEVVEAGLVEGVGDHAGADRPGGAPVDATQPGDRGLVGVLDQPGR